MAEGNGLHGRTPNGTDAGAGDFDTDPNETERLRQQYRKSKAGEQTKDENKGDSNPHGKHDHGEDDPQPEPEPIGPRPAPFSHEWMALNFSAEHHVDWRYVALWGKWQQWAGTRWRSEETLRAFELARRVCRAASHECDDEKVAREVARASSVAGVERLARADRRHAMRFDQYDAKDWDFNQPPRKE